MRAVSLSNLQIIDTLNRYYVPVFASNEDYRDQGAAPPEERAELHRIHSEGYAKKLSVGTVHAFILGPDGHLLDSMHTVNVAQPDLLLAMLMRNVEKLGTEPGAAIVQPAPPAPPACAPDSLRLRLVARYLERKGDDYKLVEKAGGNWSALPSVDWIEMPRSEWTRLLPASAKPGDSWEIDSSIASKLFDHFYPPTENNDLSTNRIDRESLKATIESITGDIAHARLEGSLRMKHWFYHKEDDRFVEATFTGYMDLDLSKRRITSLRLVTDNASYKGGGSDLPFGVAVSME